METENKAEQTMEVEQASACDWNSQESQSQESQSQAEACSTSTEPQSQAEACSTPIESQASLEAMLAEAEQRGYLRGRNERIEELMREPAPYARQSSSQCTSTEQPQPSDVEKSEPLILNNPRVSIWDR